MTVLSQPMSGQDTAFGETVKQEKTCCIHIKHVGISMFRTDDTSEPSFYETPVESLDK